MPLTSAYCPRAVLITVLLCVRDLRFALKTGRARRIHRPAALSDARRRVPGVAPIASFEFAGPLWPHAGPDGWHFVTLPAGISADIKGLTAGPRRGFGSVRVAVTVGATS